jgi:hypothetical protein
LGFLRAGFPRVGQWDIEPGDASVELAFVTTRFFVFEKAQCSIDGMTRLKATTITGLPFRHGRIILLPSEYGHMSMDDRPFIWFIIEKNQAGCPSPNQSTVSIFVFT